MKAFKNILYVVSVVLLVSACNKEQRNIGDVSEPAIMLKDTSLVLHPGETYNLCLCHQVSDVEWVSSADSVVSVNYRGVVKAHMVGKAVVTAQRKGCTTSCHVEVKEK